MNECKLCKSATIKKRKIKSPHDSLLYTVFECSKCRSCFFDLSENPVELGALYAELSEELNVQNEFKFSIYWRNQVKIIRKIIRDPRAVLDVGCRSGDFLLHWGGEVDKVGVELSTDVASIAKSRGLSIYNTFIEKTDFGHKKFDVITCYNILEHVAEPLPVIDKLISLVSENGVMVIMIPNVRSVKARFLNLIHYRWHMFCPPEHLNFYSQQFLDEYMHIKGFDLAERMHTSGGMFKLFGKLPVIGRMFLGVMFFVDYYTPLNKFSLFDHMYSYYVKK